MKKSECFLSFEEAKVKIEYWCSYRDRSVYEATQKLHQYGQTEKDIQLLIQHLLDNKFLDDERFVASFVSGKFRLKQWGKKKIHASILSKKVDKNLVLRELDKIDEDEYFRTIEGLIEKKLRSLSSEKDSWKRKQKVMQFLVGRGFEPSLVNDLFSDEIV